MRQDLRLLVQISFDDVIVNSCDDVLRVVLSSRDNPARICITIEIPLLLCCVCFVFFVLLSQLNSGVPS